MGEGVSVHLVIPCFKESRRLPRFLATLCAELAELPVGTCVVQVVENGSCLEEKAAMDQIVEACRAEYDFVRPMHSIPKAGKGRAILAGWNEAEWDDEWLGFVDGDGAIPADEVARVVQYAMSIPAAETAICASRVGDGVHVERDAVRRILGKLYHGIVQFLFDLPLRDAACGLKLFPSHASRPLLPRLRQFGWVFDVELLARWKRIGYQCAEVPVNWSEKSGSKLKLGAQVRILWRLVEVRFRLDQEI